MKTEEPKMGMGMMSEMMKNMMQNMMKESGSMSDMCTKMMEQMMGSMSESARVASYDTPEMKGLFEEWLMNLEAEVIDFVKEKGKATLSDIAEKLKISKDSIIFLIGKLAREGKLTIGEIKVA